MWFTKNQALLQRCVQFSMLRLKPPLVSDSTILYWLATRYPPLVDVLICFRCYRIALIADISRLYRAIYPTKEDKDLHRFVWRRNPTAPVLDFQVLTPLKVPSNYIINSTRCNGPNNLKSILPHLLKKQKSYVLLHVQQLYRAHL